MAYDVDVLRRGIVVIENNILEIEKALAAEREKLAEYERELSKAEWILEQHKNGDKG